MNTTDHAPLAAIHDGPVLPASWSLLRTAIECGHNINYWPPDEWRISIGGEYLRVNLATLLTLSRLGVIEKYAGMRGRWMKAVRE
jgi:hypothetical protein